MEIIFAICFTPVSNSAGSIRTSESLPTPFSGICTPSLIPALLANDRVHPDLVSLATDK
uniref:Uncharacterized protein n=1 Tax=Lotus japonicus TaxID=34305 RepID=I3S464_LOTJA|nr:unknown [Lotus japonicus]